MNWRYQLGKYLNKCENLMLRSKSSFINKNFPFGRNWVFDLKRTLLENPAYIIDAGANIGEVSKELAYYFPSAKIYAFEPIYATYHQLIKNTELFKNISSQHFALGKNEESIELYLNPESTINSIKSTYLNAENAIGKETIHIKRLDKFCELANIQHINILKIDVEGFEFEVLDGCGNMRYNQIDC
ncbi:MAG: FkbM family methyltransferase, partial [Atribacterota bacterium]|nr:FkbM family methyltransferase [Atribacterota bacterium]